MPWKSKILAWIINHNLLSWKLVSTNLLQTAVNNEDKQNDNLNYSGVSYSTFVSKSKATNTHFLLRYFNIEPSFKLQWCCAQDLFGSQIPVTTGGFELQLPCIWSSYLTHQAIRQLHMQESCSSNPPVITGICDQK